jgi:hypothetical protein
MELDAYLYSFFKLEQLVNIRFDAENDKFQLVNTVSIDFGGKHCSTRG